MTPVTPLELADCITAPVQFLVACPEPDQQAAGSLVRKERDTLRSVLPLLNKTAFPDLFTFTDACQAVLVACL